MSERERKLTHTACTADEPCALLDSAQRHIKRLQKKLAEDAWLVQAVKERVRDGQCPSYDYDGGNDYYVCGWCEWCELAKHVGVIERDESTGGKWRWHR